MKKLSIFIVMALISVAMCASVYADSVAILRQGLLGAGTGAIATAATGGKGDRVWKGALIGAGVNVVGGALLDMITGERVGTVAYIQPAQQPVYYRQAQPAVVQYQTVRPRPDSVHRRIYKQGFRAGYDRGYRDGYADAQYDIYGY
jgi:hypothetical protein